MSEYHPLPLSGPQLRSRRRRILRIARRLGFEGHIEYRHVYSKSGGAHYGIGASPQEDLLTVYAEAFDRDANPEDFSLTAIVAHECGHQLLARHPRLAHYLNRISLASEEILASILGAIRCSQTQDQDDLLAKATNELLNRGEEPETALRLVRQLRDYLENLL